MKGHYILSFLMAVFSTIAASSQTLSETYSSGDIPTSYNFMDPPGFNDYDSSCTGSSTTLSVDLPASGPWEVTGIDIEYEMTASNGAYMSEQRSYVHFQNEGVNEPLIYKGTGTTAGTFSYDRENVDIANGIYSSSTELTFEMRAWRTWSTFGEEGCTAYNNKVDDGTWTITVHYRLVLPCGFPTNVQVSSIAADEAEISWTDDGSPIEWNIEYGPEGFTQGTGTVVTATSNPDMITGLDDGTNYDVYVQASCGVDGDSYWSEGATFQTLFDCTAYSGLEILNSTGETIVCKGIAMLEAEASGDGDAIYWYDAATGGNVLGVGEDFETQFLNATTSFWASEVVLDGPGISFGHGIQTWDYDWDSSPWNDQGIAFTATDEFTIVDVEVFSTSANGGSLEVVLVDNFGLPVESTTVNLPGDGTIEEPVSVIVPLYFDVPGAGQYALVASSGGPFMKAEFTWPDVGYPFAIGSSGEMTGGYSGGNIWQDSYYYFYNWTIQEGTVQCESSREEVVATISTDGDVIVNTLPYSATHDSANYGNPFAGKPGEDCGTEENYLNGHDVIYQLIAAEDDVIDVTLSNLTGFYAGVFIYSSCADIGETCLASAVAGPDDADFGIEEFYITQGEEYYIVVSSWLTSSIEYTIDIQGFDCVSFEAPEAETDQNFVTGDALVDLEVEMTMNNFTELVWYEDAAGTIEIPETTALVDGTTYYVAQEFNGDCEGALLGITVHEIDCTALSIVDTVEASIVCRGQMTLEAEASGTGSEIYWYNAASGGDIVGVGEELVTPELVSTTSFWAAEVYIEGASQSSGHGIEEWEYLWSSSPWNDLGLAFTATESFMIVDVELFSAPWDGVGGGELTIALLNSSQNEIYSTDVVLPSGGSEANPVPVTVPLGYMVPGAGDYFLVVKGNNGTTPLKAEFLWPDVGYPFNIGDVGEITGGYSNGNVWLDAYYFLYNWTISVGEVMCESSREEIIAEVTADGDVEITSLPYTTADDTSVYGDTFSGTPGSFCGSSVNHLAGDDVVYFYSSPSDDIVNIELLNATNTSAGIFVYESCGQIGEECFAGAVLESNTTEATIEELFLEGGQDYFIVISSSNGDSTAYTLNIYGFECSEIEPPVAAEDQYFVVGSTLEDMTIETNQFNEGSIWYDDAGGTNEVPSTTVLVDGDVYYVSQTILGCESDLLEITFHELDCNELEVLATSDGAVCNSGRALLTAQGSGIGSDIYWYDAQTGGELVWVGEEFYTPNITTTTSYWASEAFIQGAEVSGGYGIETWDYDWDSSPFNPLGIAFEVTQPFTLVDVEVFSTSSGGEAIIELRNGDGDEIMTSEVVLPGGGSISNPVAHTITLNYEIPPGNYQLVFTSAPPMKAEFLWPNVGYPFDIGSVGQMTDGVSGDFLYQDAYYFFYNWTISIGDVECESDRVEAIAEIDTTEPAAPLGNAEQDACIGATLSDIDVTGDNIRWYANEDLSEVLDPMTVLQNATTYYATQSPLACESDPLKVTISLIETLEPLGSANQSYVDGETLADLEVEGNNLTWYDDEDGLNEIPETTLLEELHIYYVSQTQNDCESPLLKITAHRVLTLEDILLEDLVFYPNPVANQLTVSSSTTMDKLELYNLLGQKVLEQTVDAETAIVNVSSLASGAYMMRVYVGSEVGVYRVLKK